MDREGFLYVGDNESGQVFVFDADFKLKLKFGERGSGQGEFQSISGIAADGESIFVVDQQITPSVQAFDRHGNFLRGWGKHEMGIDNFSLPEGVALDAKGRVLVVDALRHEIKLFDREGKFIDRFGGLGKRLGQAISERHRGRRAGAHLRRGEGKRPRPGLRRDRRRSGRERPAMRPCAPSFSGLA